MLSCLLQECEEQGVPYERAKVWDVQADDAERWDAKKRKKKNPDQGFAGTYVFQHPIVIFSKRCVVTLCSTIHISASVAMSTSRTF